MSRRWETACGVTRRVFLVGDYAIKVPRVRFGWATFLRGLLSNMTERSFSKLAEQYHLSPTIVGAPGGWFAVQRRCSPITDEDWAAICSNQPEPIVSGDWHGFQCDMKRPNFGRLDGRVVLLDYGEMT